MNKDTKGIGCGAWPIILKDTSFYEACEFHDNAYTQGSFLQREKWTRKEVDDWFYGQMKMLSHGALDRMRAHLFYGIVRAVGWMFWEGKN